MSRNVVRFQITAVTESDGQMYVSGNGLDGEAFRDVLYVQAHGGAFHPPLGSLAMAMDLNGRREQMVVMGGEKAGLRPAGADLGEGNAVLYNAHGQAISVLTNEIKVKAGAKLLLEAGEIVLQASIIKLGSEGATRELALKGSVDSAGHAQTSNLATKVLAE